MPNISLKPPKSKSPSSITNLFIIFTVAAGFYLLYKYIKCIDKDISLLKLSLNTVKNDIQNMNSRIESTSTKDVSTHSNDICYTKLNFTPTLPIKDDDDASIQSDEINCILKNIAQDDTSELTEPIVCASAGVTPAIVIQPVESIDAPTTESNDISSDPVDEEEDIIICKKTSVDYQNMTNEVIKNRIKELGGVPKGNKSALIEQLISLQE